MSVVEALNRDLAGVRELSAPLADSALAATAMALAVEMDDPSNSATSKSMCARALVDALATLRTLAPPAKERDGIDRIAEQRERRRSAAAGRAAASDLPRP